MSPHPSHHPGNQIIGIVLVLLGELFLLGRVVDFGQVIGAWGWPFFAMLPGIALLVLAFAEGKSAAGFTLPGSIVTTAGLILFVQNLGEHSESWDYAWGLIMAAAGLGRFLQAASRAT